MCGTYKPRTPAKKAKASKQALARRQARRRQACLMPAPLLPEGGGDSYYMTDWTTVLQKLTPWYLSHSLWDKCHGAASEARQCARGQGLLLDHHRAGRWFFPFSLRMRPGADFNTGLRFATTAGAARTSFLACSVSLALRSSRSPQRFCQR